MNRRTFLFTVITIVAVEGAKGLPRMWARRTLKEHNTGIGGVTAGAVQIVAGP